MMALNKHVKKNITNIILGAIVVANIGYFLWRTKNKEVSNQDSKYINQRIYTQKTQLQESYLLKENWKDSISLSDLVSKHPVLILRIPAVTCQQCKFTELDNLRINFDEYELDYVCAILTVSTPRDLKSLTLSFDFRFLKLGSKIQNIFNIQEEKYNRPYYFILDSDLQASMFFFPEQTNQKFTYDYFKIIKEKYFNKQDTATSNNGIL
jgi:predicted nucleic-acid-binding Zn-ribbon protein